MNELLDRMHQRLDSHEAVEQQHFECLIAKLAIIRERLAKLETRQSIGAAGLWLVVGAVGTVVTSVVAAVICAALVNGG